jgi:hypothetical protein
LKGKERKRKNFQSHLWSLKVEARVMMGKKGVEEEGKKM